MNGNERQNTGQDQEMKCKYNKEMDQGLTSRTSTVREMRENGHKILRKSNLIHVTRKTRRGIVDPCKENILKESLCQMLLIVDYDGHCEFSIEFSHVTLKTMIG